MYCASSITPRSRPTSTSSSRLGVGFPGRQALAGLGYRSRIKLCEFGCQGRIVIVRNIGTQCIVKTQLWALRRNKNSKNIEITSDHKSIKMKNSCLCFHQIYLAGAHLLTSKAPFPLCSIPTEKLYDVIWKTTTNSYFNQSFCGSSVFTFDLDQSKPVSSAAR